MNTNQNTGLVSVTYNGEDIEVTRAVADYLAECRRDDERQSKQAKRHQADIVCEDDKIEGVMFEKPRGFEDTLIETLMIERLTEALAALPKIQRRRVMAYFYGGLTQRQIAEQEGVTRSKIENSIASAINNLKKYFGV